MHRSLVGWVAFTLLAFTGATSPAAREPAASAVASPADAARQLDLSQLPLLDGADAATVRQTTALAYDVKAGLLPAISGVLGEEVVIASSSSGLLGSRLREGCRFPGRVLVGHPFNPPHLIPLVEVVSGPGTDPWAVAAAMDFYRSVGKYPIEIRKEVPGHLANRLQAALWREAVHLVEAGVASVADVDAAITEGPGLRWALMGPHATFHLAGGAGGMAHFMDHLMPAVTSWWEDLGQPVVTQDVQRMLVAGVDEEMAGRSVAEMAARRDAFLTALLALRRTS